MTELLTEQQAAALLHVSVKCLQGWRSRGGGPRYHKLGRCVRYAVPDLEAFVQDAVRRSTSDAGRTSQDSPQIRVEQLLAQTGRTLDGPAPNAPALPRSKRS